MRTSKEQAASRAKLSRAVKRADDLEDELDKTENKLGAAKAIVSDLQKRAAKATSDLRVSKLESAELEKELAQQRMITDTRKDQWCEHHQTNVQQGRTMVRCLCQRKV